MKLRHILLFLTAFTLTWSVFAAVPQAKGPAKKAQAKKAQAKKTVAKKAPAKAAAGKARPQAGKVVAKKGGKVAAKPAPSRSRQMQPTQDRYKEIQQALADKGYLKSEPSGVWSSDSVEALKQFQSEQNIPATGKLNSRSIIGLGLGPKTAGPLVLPPPEPSSVRPQF